MQLGMIGLGKMGGNMTRRLLRGGHQVVALNFRDDDDPAAYLASTHGVDHGARRRSYRVHH